MASVESKKKPTRKINPNSKTTRTSSKKTVSKSKVVRKNSKKKTLMDKMLKYIYPSAIFALMMTMFNYIFMIFSLYSDASSGLYMWIFDNVVINVVFNTIFDFIFFFVSFLAYTYLLIEMVLLPEK